jgi:hypothetical protein
MMSQTKNDAKLGTYDGHFHLLIPDNIQDRAARSFIAGKDLFSETWTRIGDVRYVYLYNKPCGPPRPLKIYLTCEPL